MPRRKPETEKESHDRWLISYADFITLLFAFFVMMFASSQSDKIRAKLSADSVRKSFEHTFLQSKIAAVLGGTVNDKGQGNALRNGPGGRDPAPEGAELASSYNMLSSDLKREIEEGKIDMRMEARGLVVSLREANYFETGSDAVSEMAGPVLERIAAAVGGIANPVHLEGHTDSVPMRGGRFRSNWELSAARAIAVMEVLAERFGVDRKRMAVAGYAENFPIAPNDTAEGRARNRRVDVVILNSTALIAQPGG